ncbi:LOB domain-containing protein 20 [Brachypodium distachyon]|uniref:LOB domain-containing protein n=1 Tax=Brachypodium distachyon TaxID=15368 RepID=I1H9P9_BRADI|nr:LOB domain-containing protein 20 [Brachypodium distachyon]KQK23638.1 hypothetical protein BRADI_1g75110v3 [Brachypodium distachyon]|eukprot:XP_003562079.1 LOB domain-containing protein 20 [Brachypodium distachyon]
MSMTGFGSPCGACKFLRRKCARGCVFAPYFCHEQGAAHFAAIHKVFGASNVSKLLAHLPLADRAEAAVTVSYEAQARLRDPVYGCVAHIFALQQQVMTLQAQLASFKQHAAHAQHQQAAAAMAQEDASCYSYPWCNGNDVAAAAAGGGFAGGGNGVYGGNNGVAGAGHDESAMSVSEMLLGGSAAASDYYYAALEQDGHVAAESSAFGAEESGGWRSSSSTSGYQDCEDLQSVAYAYLNRS